MMPAVWWSAGCRPGSAEKLGSCDSATLIRNVPEAQRQPRMRRKTTRMRGRPEIGMMLDGGSAPVTDHNRRILVARAEHDAERLELARLGRDDLAPHLLAGMFARCRILVEAVLDEMVTERSIVFNRFGDRTLMHGPALYLVRGEQHFTAPSAQNRGELPAEINAVRDAEVHSISAEGRMKVTGVAGEEHAPVTIAVGAQPVRGPDIALEDFGETM